MSRVYISNGVIYLSKQAGTPATPAADELGIYLDSNELPAFMFDTGVARNVPAWVPAVVFSPLPGITFGGGATGLTYSTQVARYERIGSRVFFEIFIALATKGSSTGVALVTNLPVAANTTASLNKAVIVRLDGMSSISGSVQGFISPSGTTIRLEHLGTGTAAQLTEANFTNGSSVMVAGAYES